MNKANNDDSERAGDKPPTKMVVFSFSFEVKSLLCSVADGWDGDARDADAGDDDIS